MGLVTHYQGKVLSLADPSHELRRLDVVIVFAREDGRVLLSEGRHAARGYGKIIDACELRRSELAR